MKKIIAFFLFFTLTFNLFSAEKKSYTYRVKDLKGCYAKYICDVKTTQPICSKGHETGWECICEPWNC